MINLAVVPPVAVILLVLLLLCIAALLIHDRAVRTAQSVTSEAATVVMQPVIPTTRYPGRHRLEDRPAWLARQLAADERAERLEHARRRDGGSGMWAFQGQEWSTETRELVAIRDHL
jgi:hypothetical protein